MELATKVDSIQPITFGVPFPKGLLRRLQDLSLWDTNGQRVPLQTETLEAWSDGSIAWFLVDALIEPERMGKDPWKLCWSTDSLVRDSPVTQLEIIEQRDTFLIQTGTVDFRVNRHEFAKIDAHVGTQQILRADGSELRLTDVRISRPEILRTSIETRGPVRCTLRFDGEFPHLRGLRFVGRLSFFAGTGLVKVRVRIHNPDRARHPGGLWDLGDDKSILLRDLSLNFELAGDGPYSATWRTERDSSMETSDEGFFEIYQNSSGGENWDSANHCNQDGVVPLTIPGYSAAWGEKPRTMRGRRAEPVVSLRSPEGSVSVAIPEFWQQFPKAIGVHDNILRVGIFAGIADPVHATPLENNGTGDGARTELAEMGYGFELQGGEQKSHTFWLQVDGANFEPEPLNWVFRPALVTLDQGWLSASGGVTCLPSNADAKSTPLDIYLDEALTGPSNLFWKREAIDEYGWRNFGDVFADHEATYYTGALPLVSHYNNQYDQVWGFLFQFLRTGDRRWWTLGDPLARHVVDIDIYHTVEDKAAYSGGMFWFTDHYLHAHTSTHRTYSKANKPDTGQYGGGPSSMIVYTSGLTLYYLLTGDPDAKDAVLELAHWLLRSEDSRFHPLGLLDNGPTGQSTSNKGPHRSAGNTINTILDAWRLTKDRMYFDHVEVLIRRTTHPHDNIAAMDLLDIENRWSYTIYLTSLDRYLEIKSELGEIDEMYAYARATLRAYGQWMLQHEIPYFEQESRLEFPTESWGAQEFRKANVLRAAAKHEQDPVRTQMLDKARQLSDRGWHDILRFPTKHVARAIALVMADGTVDAFLRVHGVTPLSIPHGTYDFGQPTKFSPIRARIMKQLKSPRGILRLAGNLCNPKRLALLFHRPTDLRASVK